MMSSINDKLPNEMLVKIFGYLDSESSARACRAVCPRWKTLVDATVGVTCAIASKPEVVTHHHITGEEIVCPQIPPSGISTLGIKFCSVGLIENLNFGAGLHFGYPTCLKSLHFRGPLPQHIFESLTLPLTSLTEFSIHYSSLMYIDLGKSDSSKVRKFEFPVLKTLSMCSKKFNPTTDLIGITLVLENARYLLNSIKSRCLDTLFLDIPHFPLDEVQMADSIFKCIDRHWRTLRFLDMFFCVSFQKEGKVEVGSGPSGLNLDQGMDVVGPNHKTLFEWTQFRALFLKRICISCGKSMKTYEDWKEFMRIQCNLEEVYWMNEEVIKCVTGASMISANLRKILFQLNDVDTSKSMDPEFDCGIFAGCSGLTHLLVRGRTGLNAEQNMRIRAIVSNGHKLPESLELLSLRELNVPSEVLSEVVKKCLNIRKFRLIDIGTTGALGLGPTLFWDILHTMDYEQIEISNSFNRYAFRTCERTDVYLDSLFSMIMNTQFFHAVKVDDDSGQFEDSFYTFKSGPMFLYQTIDGIRPHEVCDVVFQ